MGLSEEGEESILHRFEELCLDLNMDTNAKEEALQNYQRIQTNFTLEGDQLHWLACALYEACRRSMVPTVGRGTLEGNCVSLTRLLRSAKFSLIQFFNKMRKWSDMANLNQDFRDKVDRLERNFAVSTVIFKKFEPIFLDIFRDPATDVPRQQRNKKQRRLPCTVSDVFSFAWTMFVQVKGNFPAISDDLVNSYHLLLCCVDWFFANALLGARRDLLKPDFAGLPENYNSRDWKAPGEAPCLMDLLCEKHDGLVVEAKTIKEHWWKPHIKRLFERKMLKGKIETLSAVLEIGNFEANVKGINNAYEEYVLSVGDFDERIFLGDDAEEEIGTPGGQRVASLSDEMQRRSLKQHVEETRSLAPATPLTGRRYLKDKDQCHVTPVSTATQSVSRLQALLSGRKTSPSDFLIEEFKACSKNPLDDVMGRVKEMGKTFCSHYVQPLGSHPGAHIDFARKRLQLGESLYFKMLESIVLGEKKRLGASGKDSAEKVDLTGLLSHDLFHRSLLACCLEIVIFSYNSQRVFPWIVDIFELAPYHFYKVVEIIIRAEEGLSRDVVKHLNHIEESILECLAWRSTSPLWDAIKESTSVPSCEDVTPLTQPPEARVTRVTTSPAQHPRVRSLVSEGMTARPQARSILPKDPLASPTGPSAADIFSSPQPGSAKRRLFQTAAVSKPPTSGESVLIKQLNTGVGDTVATATRSAAQQGPPSTTQTIMAVTSDGRQILIPMNVLQSTGGVTNITATVTHSPKRSIKPRKTGSLALFFRKVYHLASVRLRELCDQLQVVDEELRSKMWTCFEHALTQDCHLMCDRHLDQLLMCSVYIMAKVTEKPLNFQDIMKCYRFQPQAQSHVYRSVLLDGRRRHTSGSSNESATSRSSSPTNDKEESKGERERKRTESLANVRSSSTLPVPCPNSQPPTPTRLGGNGRAFDFSPEERGDLIQFYNLIFTAQMRKFAMKFSTQNVSGDQPKLSPLPQLRSQKASPRRVSHNHEVYISPHRTAVTKTTPKGLSYCINKSPARDLLAINKMIRSGGPKMTPLKRTLEVDRDEDSLESPAKSPCLSGHLMRRLQDFSQDREEAKNLLT
ncbi:retinoblastoma-like protein 1 [Babylonia areolata]|uniref:retinoblastoma-like protein 1 n=1 Tax=Babylonia areolata TaxID=304850 RepID=UPI003FD419EE